MRDIDVSVCVCTYRRPVLLRRLLVGLRKQDTRGEFTFEIVVADNDDTQSARGVVEEMAASGSVPITYASEPRRSISLVRNKTLEVARGKAIAFVDDDEYAGPTWLLELVRYLKASGAAGVLGPVRPEYEVDAPEWVRKGGFYNRPEHESGHVMLWQECRTGNVIFDRKIIAGMEPVFRPEFGTGGGDVDFFRRMMETGHVFVWCNEAGVTEIVSRNRWRRSVLIKRALLRGKNSFRHKEGRVYNVAKALLAVPLYTLVLPFMQLGGHHLFMRYLVKLCDHGGRLLAAARINTVRERPM